MLFSAYIHYVAQTHCGKTTSTTGDLFIHHIIIVEIRHCPVPKTLGSRSEPTSACSLTAIRTNNQGRQATKALSGSEITVARDAKTVEFNDRCYMYLAPAPQKSSQFLKCALKASTVQQLLLTSAS
jgi:hypothetical protein